MSAGRSFRRRGGRMMWRTPGVEPSAETRAWVGRMIAAHDADEVSLEQFLKLAREWAVYMSTRPKAECIEAGLQLQEHVARDLLGRPDLHAVGVGWLPRKAGR